MIERTIIYKVYGCDTGGSPTLDAEFLELKSACKYAVANRDKIAHGLPDVEQHTYSYNPSTFEVKSSRKVISPEQIYFIYNNL